MLDSTPHTSSPVSQALREQCTVEGAGRNPGFALAPACIFTPLTPPLVVESPDSAEVRTPDQVLDEAVQKTRAHLEELMAQRSELPALALGMATTVELLGESQITQVREEMHTTGSTPAQALHQVFAQLADSIEDSLPDRAYEVRALLAMLLENLRPGQAEPHAHLTRTLARITGPKILVAGDLAPAEALVLDPREVQGIVINQAGPLSHVALVIHDLGIPCVTNIDLVQKAALVNGDLIALDGDTGKIIVRPKESTIAVLEARAQLTSASGEATPLQQHAPRTRDGARLRILGDLMDPARHEELMAQRAEGVGLVRSELLLLRSNRWLREQEQEKIYREILQSCSPQPVTIRTFDLGDDKMSDGLGERGDAHTGLRGIRFALAIRPEELTLQLRALIQAAATVGNELRIVFPMVLDIGDMRRARKLYDDAVAALLREERIPRAPQNISLGAMIETSAAVELITPILRWCDFVSIGTNDLLVSTLDADRNKSTSAHYHPAFLSCVRRVIQAAATAGKEVFVCGDMPNHPRNVPLLIGVGARNIVVHARAIAAVNAKIARCEVAPCESLVSEIIDSGDGEDAHAIHLRFLESIRAE